jgi:hypothetical protein
MGKLTSPIDPATSPRKRKFPDPPRKLPDHAAGVSPSSGEFRGVLGSSGEFRGFPREFWGKRLFPVLFLGAIPGERDVVLHFSLPRSYPAEVLGAPEIPTAQPRACQ